MSEENEQDTFTFVDQRRSATSDEGSAAAESTVDLDDDDEQYTDDEVDSLGSYGLAAYVTGLIASDAWQKMGLIADPTTGKVTKDLKQAQFSIDCVSAVVAQLELRESVVPGKLLQDLKRVLNDLRLNFIEQSRR